MAGFDRPRIERDAASIIAAENAFYGTIFATTVSTVARPTPTPTGELCDGNQVLGDCVEAPVPSDRPGFTCIKPKVYGGSQQRLRYNTEEAQNAMSTYCENLIADKVVLNRDRTSVQPGIVPGAEEGGNIALTVLFSAGHCANSPTPDSVDFERMGQQTCEQFFGQINQLCKSPLTL